MAEPVSSIVTLVTVSLAIIRKTTIFILDASEIDTTIQRLYRRLIDLQDYLRLVEAELKGAEEYDENVPRCIGDALVRCKEVLGGVKKTVKGLASRRSDNIYQKLKLKIYTDTSTKKEVSEAIEELGYQKQHIRDCMAILHQSTSNSDRRTSNAHQTPQLLAVDHFASAYGVVEEENIASHSPIRSISSASTVFDRGFANKIARSPSLATTNSYYSKSSGTSSALQSPSEESGVTPLDRKNTVATIREPDLDIHYQISANKDDEIQTQAIRKILEQHPQPSVLANKKDEYGRTPLFLAAKFGYVCLARMLVYEFAADINARDSEPCSVLDRAVSNNRQKFVTFLLNSGVDEKNLLPYNRVRFTEMKATVALRKEMAAKQKGKSKAKTKVRTTTTRVSAT